VGASGFVLHFGAFVLSGLVAGLTTALVASTLPTTLEEDEDRTLLLGIYMGLSFAVAFSTQLPRNAPDQRRRRRLHLPRARPRGRQPLHTRLQPLKARPPATP